MYDEIPAIVGELLFYERAPVYQTQAFQYFMHNDNLCPTAERQLGRALRSFQKNRAVAYDIQRLRDEGTDVLLRYNPDPDANDSVPRFLSLQIKSYDDLNRPGLHRSLKSQYFDSITEFGPTLDHYYVLLATDRTIHADRIREINKLFSIAANVTVVDPNFALTFFHLSKSEINLVADNLLRSEDIVREEAADRLTGLSPSQACIILAGIWRHTMEANVPLQRPHLESMQLLQDLYTAAEAINPDSMAARRWSRRLEDMTTTEKIDRDLEGLEGTGVEVQERTGQIAVDVQTFLPVQAVDARRQHPLRIPRRGPNQIHIRPDGCTQSL